MVGTRGLKRVNVGRDYYKPLCQRLGRHWVPVGPLSDLEEKARIVVQTSGGRIKHHAVTR